jgi:arylsulfatase A-like enzyme
LIVLLNFLILGKEDSKIIEVDIMNIIQIVSDTFRRDNLGCYGNTDIHTEYLDRFAKQSIVFDNAYIASWPTIPHRRDLFTGRHSYIYSWWWFYGEEPNLPHDEIILSESLNKAGFTTMLIADTYHLMRDRHGFDKGFNGWIWVRGHEADRYITRPLEPNKDRSPNIVGEEFLRNTSLRRFENEYFVAQTVQESEKWLEMNYDKHENFFLHVDTFDPHEPWDPPKWYRRMYAPDWDGTTVPGMAYGKDRVTIAENLSEEDLAHLKALYSGQVTLVDRWLGKLLQKIEDLGLYEDTMVVFTSDHGTYIGEHNAIGKTPVLYQEIAHIPLIIKVPDSMGIKSGRNEAIVQPPDLMPTFLDLAGAEIPNTVQGKSLLPIIRGEIKQVRDAAVSSGSVVHTNFITITDGELSLIASRKDFADEHDEMTVAFDFVQKGLYKAKVVVPHEDELFDLRTDPSQSNNLLPECKEEGMRMRSKMIEILESLGADEQILIKWKE